MSNLLEYCPTSPDFALRWEAMEQDYEWLRNLRGCPQDPIFHAEGDVAIHTRMVCAELVALPAWRALPADERQLLFAAAVLHDVGKPDCTKLEEHGRITSRGHSRRGAILARQILWRMRVPFAVREQIASLIRYHQAPYYLIERDDPVRLAIEISQTTRGDLLALLAEADVRGRISQTKQHMLDNVALFAEQMAELGCVRSPFRFPSEAARVLYFRDRGRHPESPVPPKFRSDVVIMSGLPGAGKDSHVRKHFSAIEQISLDHFRAELDVSPDDAQGAVLQAAWGRARELLRKEHPFVWNATNLSRQIRGQSIQLCLDYGARVSIVYVEVAPQILAEQNRRRGGTAQVPTKAIERMFDRWEVPDLTEAHAVELAIEE